MSGTQQPEALRLASVIATPKRPAIDLRNRVASELRSQHARIAELEAQLSAIGAGGVEPLRKQAVRRAPAAPVPQGDGKINPADFNVETFRRSGNGWLVKPDNCVRITHVPTGLFEEGVSERSIHTNKAEAWERLSARLEALADAHPAEGVPVQVVELEVDDLIDRLLNAQQDLNLAANVHMDQSIASASTLLDEVEIALRALAATNPTQQGLDKVTLLSKDHTGMKVDYSGLLGQVRREIKRSAPGLAEMIRQLQEHMQELGQRWYAGDTAVVDELLQLYSVERQARDALAAQAKQGGAA